MQPEPVVTAVVAEDDSQLVCPRECLLVGATAAAVDFFVPVRHACSPSS
jgi:hypothetical protein